MIRTPLCDLCVKYGTDKVIWGYTPHYYTELVEDREAVRAVLEVGICGFRDIPNNVVGASLFVWRDYFPNAMIYGIDNDPRFIFHDQHRIQTMLADAYNPYELSGVMEHFGVKEFDMIVDDAIHDPSPQVLLLSMLYYQLKHDGRYFIEEACPYKVDGDILDWYKARLGPGMLRGLHACVTHKPEELVIGIK